MANDLGTEEIRNYLHYLAIEKQVSASYLKSAYSALKFLYERTLRQDWDSISLPCSKVPKQLPVVLSTTEVQKILDPATNLKYKAILMTVYGAGLRVSDVVNLKIRDIDSKYMQIRVQQGKGKKTATLYSPKQILKYSETIGASIDQKCGCFQVEIQNNLSLFAL